jgi:hypothetical protein
MEVTKMEHTEIKVQPWEWSDGDGCSDYGINITINGRLVTERGDDLEHALQMVAQFLMHKPADVYGYEAGESIADNDDASWVMMGY